MCETLLAAPMLMYPIGATEFRSQSLSASLLYVCEQQGSGETAHMSRSHARTQLYLGRLVMLVVILNIRSAGSSEPSLLTNVMSTTFSREDAIIFRSPCHACRGTEYRKRWLV